MYGTSTDIRLTTSTGGVTQSAVSEMLPWTRRDVGVYQDFLRRYAALALRIEDVPANVYMCFYLLRRDPDAAGRMARGACWPHLPALESILAPGDRAYDVRDLQGARGLYLGAKEAYPGYVWVHQRLGEIHLALGRRDLARREFAEMRRLGGE